MTLKEKVTVGMSGGVDSSVAAALLVDQGYAVSGVMLKLWSDEASCADNSCCPPEAIAQARQVAGILGIPFYVIDIRELFKSTIVDSFIDGYKRGITPNPCFSCNRLIRWGYLLDRVVATGGEKFATGHYARVETSDGIFKLKKGIDLKKDQSYVLAGLDQSQLAHSIFPLGELRKTEVRDLARKFGLPVAEKQDSQDLCFVGIDGYREFLRRIAPESFSSGEIRSSDGKLLGKHDGLANYTIGQRKGLGAGFAEPLYVLEKDAAKNEIVAGNADELGKAEFTASVQNFRPDVHLENCIFCEVKTRYKSALIPAEVIIKEPNEVIVRLERKQKDLTPGQIAVFYGGDEVLGSAVIKSVALRGDNK